MADKKTTSPIIPDKAKEFPANNIPPKGIAAYQLARDGTYWSVWGFRVKENGDIEAEKILEKELYQTCRMKVAELTLEYQLGLLK